jgi:membrane protein DedA with SNARE-associated domain
MIAPWVLEWISHYGPPAIFVLLALGVVGLPVPDELLMTFIGSLIYRGDLPMIPSVLAALGGAMTGISMSYALGRGAGHVLIKHGHYFHVTPQRIERTHAWFERFGKWTLILGYFIPGVRHLTAFVAGSSRLHLGAFALFAYAGALLWVATFLTLGYVLGERWHHALGHVVIAMKIAATAALLIGIVVWTIYWRRRAHGR